MSAGGGLARSGHGVSLAYSSTHALGVECVDADIVKLALVAFHVLMRTIPGSQIACP